MKKSFVVMAIISSCVTGRLSSTEPETGRIRWDYTRGYDHTYRPEYRGHGPAYELPTQQEWIEAHQTGLENLEFGQELESIILNERMGIWIQFLTQAHKELAGLSIEQRQAINGYSYTSTDFALSLMNKNQLKEYKDNLLKRQKEAKKVALKSCCPSLQTEEQRTIFVTKIDQVLKQIDSALKHYSQVRVEANIKALSDQKMWVGGKLILEKFKS